MSSVNTGVTGPNFAKFSHDIQVSFALLMRTLTISHSVSECQSDESGEFAIFFTKSVAIAMSLEISKKRGPGRSSEPKMLSFSEKIAKIGTADPEIFCLKEIIKDKN